jgi:hypothetical protein
MPKDGRGKKTPKAKPGRGGATMADRVTRLRAQIEELSDRLASAEETLIAAGGVALARSEKRMSRLLEMTDAAGARLESELGAAVAALFEPPAAAAPEPAPTATPRRSPAAPKASRKRATTPAPRKSAAAIRSAPRGRKGAAAGSSATARATPTRKGGARGTGAPRTGATPGTGSPAPSRRGRRTPPKPPA